MLVIYIDKNKIFLSKFFYQILNHILYCFCLSYEFFLSSSLMVGAHTIKCGEMRCLEFELRPLYKWKLLRCSQKTDFFEKVNFDLNI